MALVRGRVYAATIDSTVGEMLYLVVSNNARNHGLGSALVVRLTTTPKLPRPSIVELPHGESFNDRVSCDDIEVLYVDEVARDAGALSARTMQAVDNGLKAALALKPN